MVRQRGVDAIPDRLLMQHHFQYRHRITTSGSASSVHKKSIPVKEYVSTDLAIAGGHPGDQMEVEDPTVSAFLRRYDQTSLCQSHAVLRPVTLVHRTGSCLILFREWND